MLGKGGGGVTLAVNLVEQRVMVLYCWSKQTNIRRNQMKPTSKVSFGFRLIELKQTTIVAVQCTEVRLPVSFPVDLLLNMAVINPPEKKLAKCT